METKMRTVCQIGFLLTALCIALTSHAQAQRTVLAALGPWKAVKVFDKGEQYLEFQHQSKAALIYRPENRGSFMITTKKVMIKKYPRPLLISIWQEGASNTAIRIFDPGIEDRSEIQLFSQNSKGTIRYEVKNDQIKISYFDPEGQLRGEVWRPELE